MEYLENSQAVFYGIFFLMLAFTAVGFFIGGRKSEAGFSKLSAQNVVFREQWASGHSKKSLLTQAGGANKVLDVVVTDAELWIKGIHPAFSFIASKYDLLHKIPLASISAVELKGGRVELEFVNEAGSRSHISLLLKNASEFIKAVNG